MAICKKSPRLAYLEESYRQACENLRSTLADPDLLSDELPDPDSLPTDGGEIDGAALAIMQAGHNLITDSKEWRQAASALAAAKVAKKAA